MDTVEDFNNKISDEALAEIYMKCDSIENSTKYLKDILIEENIEEHKITNILKKYSIKLIPPGTKGAVRGKTFNNIVKNHILSLTCFNDKDFEIKFETRIPTVKTDEIPDWYIHQISTKKTVIGMNQLDLWSGGHQINRAGKYIMDDGKYKDEKIFWLSVVCRSLNVKKKNKIYNIIKYGIEKNRFCYISRLEIILKNIFNLA